MRVNGSEYNQLLEGTVTDVLTQLDLKMERVVVEVNGVIVPKSQYDTSWIDKAAEVEIVCFVGGG